MKYIEIVADADSLDTIAAVADKVKARDFRPGLVGEDGMQSMRMLVPDDQVQKALDILQTILGAQSTSKILVMNIETALPLGSHDDSKVEDSAVAAREAIYDDVVRGARCSPNYYVLIFLSTVVAAIGLMEDNVAVLIGAMVIAPLLGPNLGFSLGTVLGNLDLMRRSTFTLISGLILAIVMAFFLGLWWPEQINSAEIHSRTLAGLDAVALALASGAAAALSLTTGLSSVLVGVMVAVALLPPAVTLGMLLGSGEYGLAGGAGTLLAINVVCLNLATKTVFVVKGISPRTWAMKEKARRATRANMIGWVVLLALLVFIIFWRQALVG